MPMSMVYSFALSSVYMRLRRAEEEALGGGALHPELMRTGLQAWRENPRAESTNHVNVSFLRLGEDVCRKQGLPMDVRYKEGHVEHSQDSVLT